MTLKLFRTTGYSSMLVPGEARLALHPAWVVAGVSAWIGFVCNAALWRAVFEGDQAVASRALDTGLVVGAGVGLVLSALGWRRTLKPAASLLLLLAAGAAASLWTRPQALDIGRLQDAAGLLFPGWASLLGWQVPVTLGALGLVPMLFVWNSQVRRLSGPDQLAINLKGMALSGVLLLGIASLHSLAP